MRNPNRARWAAVVAVLAPGWWLLTVLVLHVVTADEYDPVEQTISELALLRYGTFMDVAFVALGIGGLALALGLRWTVRGALAAPILLAVTGVLWMVLGPFRTGTGGAEEAIHNTAAIISFIVIMPTMFLFWRRFRGDERWASFARPALVWTLAAAAAFLLFPILGERALGVSQRLFVAVILSWMIATGVRLWSISSPVKTRV